MTDFFGIHWAGIDRIITLPLLIIVIFFIFRRYTTLKKNILQLVHPKNKALVLPHFSLKKEMIKTILVSAAPTAVGKKRTNRSARRTRSVNYARHLAQHAGKRCKTIAS
jgi:hypothetical protein